jgi:hypothetical protein
MSRQPLTFRRGGRTIAQRLVRVTGLSLRLAGALLLLVTAPARAQAGFTPISDMRAQTYLGFSGGLYENGTNGPPADHAAAGAVRAALVQPLDTSGNPSAAGKIALLSIGMSNTTQEFCSQGGLTPCDSWTFTGQAATDGAVNHTTLLFINGARAGQTAPDWDSPTDPDYDRVRDTDLANAGATEKQVQVVWVKVANATPNTSLPNASADAYTLETQMGNIVRALKTRYVNLCLVYFSSRIYAGYATTTLNPEPYAYESGFAVKWLVQAQINQMRNGGTIVDARAGDLNYTTGAPWIAWGPYLWANGTTPRSDGLSWLQTDLQSDGTHPSQSGQRKVGAQLLFFFKTAPTARRWFLAGCASGAVCGSFFTLTPCRLIDTRNPTGPYGGPSLAAGASRSFTLAGQCGIPPTATALSVNVVSIGPTSGPAFLTGFPGGMPRPLISTVNAGAGQIRANNAILTLGGAGDISVYCGQGSGTADVVIDVNGYFQ